ncbi:RHS repeat-associated core domain-containing protein [Shewanella sp. VB17]|uniref:RHS repeat-associated core domain-containing protein n=1 Tax=Shewanella sp. VB17 TaxID=2739432 RepID=UPI001562FDD1|nr:RHS repeat-associated core domain-containing protein [Shewanella sp. VB17]NRD75252.1 RHS repeat-associated core domain-containing protein [Shewanella sp. VB17]
MINYHLSRRQLLQKMAMATPAIGALASLPFNALSSPFLSSLLSIKKAELPLAILQDNIVGFNGELKDRSTGGYLLGNGYRAYRPALQRFMSPDSWSPFGEAGVNAYAYSSNNPVNRFDPSGHLDVGTFLLGLGAVIVGVGSAVAAPFTGGSSLAIGASVAAGVFGATSGALKIADSAIEDENTSKNLAIASATFGLAQTVTGAAGAVGGAAQKTGSVGKKGYKSEHKVVKTKGTQKSYSDQRADVRGKTNEEFFGGSKMDNKDMSNFIFNQYDRGSYAGKKSAGYKGLTTEGKNVSQPKKSYQSIGSTGYSSKTTRSATTGASYRATAAVQGTNVVGGLLSFGGGLTNALASPPPAPSDDEASDIRASALTMSS